MAKCSDAMGTPTCARMGARSVVPAHAALTLLPDLDEQAGKGVVPPLEACIHRQPVAHLNVFAAVVQATWVTPRRPAPPNRREIP